MWLLWFLQVWLNFMELRRGVPSSPWIAAHEPFLRAGKIVICRIDQGLPGFTCREYPEEI